MEIRGQRFNWGERTYIMGILNVTPDSFSDGGEWFDLDRALDRVREILPYIDILDIGGESTRPGAMPVSEEEELGRVIPRVSKIRAEFPDLVISVDTMKSRVAEEGLKNGADIINDVSSGRYDPRMLATVAAWNAPLILMHMEGMPQTMQLNPTYNDVVTEVVSFLLERVNAAKASNVQQIIIDPGIGFGKTLEHNLAILRHLSLFRELGYPLLLGVSRKSFIGALTNQPEPGSRIFGTAAACTIGIMQGVDILRVHDPREMKEVSTIGDAICRGANARRARVKG